MAEIVTGTGWLADHLLDAEVVPVDVRAPFFYAQAHIPSAVNLPEFALSSPAGGPPDATLLADQLSILGISRDTHVVAYDSGDSAAAARLYWVLTYYRHPHVSVLDGGLTKWRHEGRDWEYTPVQRPPAEYRVGEPDTTVIADTEQVKAALGAPDTVVVDVRSPAEYLGYQATARRDGHMPGAINIEWSNNLEQIEPGVYQLKSDEALSQLYRTAGVTPDKRVIVHCQSGNRSSETFLALQRLGYPDVGMYLPGWMEWGNREDTPVEDE